MGIGQIWHCGEPALYPGASREIGFARYDFSPVALAAPVLGFVLAGGKPSFDVDLAAFAEEPLASVRQPLERNYPETFGALLLCTVAI